MAAADQSIAMMDGTYFVGRKEILDWVNGICGTNLSKVEQTCTGAVACQILDSIYPGKVPMSKVDWSANKDYEYINNYKVLQKCFTNLKIEKHIEVDRLVRGKYQDNLEFMQWFKKFYELNASGMPYDGPAQREKGKGGSLYTSKFGAAGGSSAPSPTLGSSTAAARRKPAVSSTASRVGAKPPGAPSTLRSATAKPSSAGAASSAAAAAAAAAAAQHEKELEELTVANEGLTNENGELRLVVRSKMASFIAVWMDGESSLRCVVIALIRWKAWRRSEIFILASSATLRSCCRAWRAPTRTRSRRACSRSCTPPRRSLPAARPAGRSPTSTCEHHHLQQQRRQGFLLMERASSHIQRKRVARNQPHTKHD